MKNHIIYLLLLCTFSLSTAFGQVRFGVKGGVTFTDAVFEQLGQQLETDMKTTFHIGPIVEFGLSETIGVNAALLYAGRGYKAETTFLGTEIDLQSSIWYLQVPINIVYDADIFYFSGGPYFGFAVGGTTEEAGVESDIEFGSSSDDNLGASDVGINVELGVNLNQLRLGVGYGLGLSNNIPGDQKGDNNSAKYKNNAINVSATYFFGG